ncbi:hypothetical protein ABBQ32_002074 [Trebouxia sp. C0010 RCD-2024]
MVRSKLGGRHARGMLHVCSGGPAKCFTVCTMSGTAMWASRALGHLVKSMTQRAAATPGYITAAVQQPPRQPEAATGVL